MNRVYHEEVPELRNYGMLDEYKVSEYFNIPVKDIKGELIEFERVARFSITLSIGEWLDLPNEDLDGGSPRDLLLQGHVADVASMLEDHLLGHPN